MSPRLNSSEPGPSCILTLLFEFYNHLFEVCNWIKWGYCNFDVSNSLKLWIIKKHGLLPAHPKAWD
jgi:hypothetical protein